MDGYEVVRQLKANEATKNIHVTAVTGYEQDIDVQRGREAGFDNYVLKPAPVDEILRQLTTLAGVRLH